MYLLTLIFGIVLLHKAHTLKCYECVPGISGTCIDIAKQCPLSGQHCGAMRVISYAGDSKVIDVNVKSCALAEECIDGSVNFGLSRTIITSKCCTSNLCNTQPAAEPGRSNPNGKKCFSCDGRKCTTTLNCEGNEDHCISAAVNIGGKQTTVKGCASKLMCLYTATAQISGPIGTEVNCCQGDFCNSAGGSTHNSAGGSTHDTHNSAGGSTHDTHNSAGGSTHDTHNSAGGSTHNSAGGSTHDTHNSAGGSTSAGLMLLVAPLFSLVVFS